MGVDDLVYRVRGGGNIELEPCRQRGDRRAAGLWINLHSSAQEITGVEVAQHQVGVGDRGLDTAKAVAGGARDAPALRGPTWGTPPESIQAILPPPAPTSARSTTGILIGWPVLRPPILTRPPTRKSLVMLGWPPRITPLWRWCHPYRRKRYPDVPADAPDGPPQSHPRPDRIPRCTWPFAPRLWRTSSHRLTA